MTINSRDKGVRGELEFAKFLRDCGFEAERGQQHAGGGDSPDVRCKSLPNVHFEVKRTERGSLYKWLEQALGDAGGAGGKLAVVAHRKNRGKWVAVLQMDDLITLLEKAGYVE